MNRQSALVLTILIFLIFGVLTYYGAKVTFCSSVVFAAFVSLIILNVLYPINQTTDDPADFTLAIYAAVIVIFIVLIGLYLTLNTLASVR